MKCEIRGEAVGSRVVAQRPMHASDIKLTNDLETVLAGICVCACSLSWPVLPRNHHFCFDLWALVSLPYGQLCKFQV